MKIATTVLFCVLFLVGCTASARPNSSVQNTSQAKPSITDATIIPASPANILAGDVSKYLEFSQAEYDKAILEHKVIYLEFYAAWCPTCKAQEPALFSTFDELNDPNLVGFRVNYKDSSTDSSEIALADNFNVSYQHTKVILHDGQVLFNKNEIWDKKTAYAKLSAYLNEHEQGH